MYPCLYCLGMQYEYNTQQWRIQNFIMEGRTVNRGGVWEGGSLQKKIEFLPEKRWILVHSRVTFYVYAKIGQVNGGHPLPPPGSATAIFQKWLKIDGYMLRGV